ncbi:hypothetical protein CKO11_12210 [Rhodobacter sp. TJ_12]|uniref:VOC family protein n=1 Tax=Rhodobacter sp. TJ_12 TaxID=2029399 RepID=UPI001CBEBDCE|nr:VOC family protein [Rhodobacter sp. TJ_12]MBZ4023221.1 hypothetical protein [Rhodobacter sp. TJ_12]
MRRRGVNHIELSVRDYEASVAFYDALFGWLGYSSFWTLDVGYRSTYYMAGLPFPHSYIGLQPAQSGAKMDFAARPVGLHHLALWARSRAEVDRFYNDFLIPRGVAVSDAPAAYDLYAPGYYAVFFDDPINGFHLELAYIPRIATPAAYWRWWRAMKKEERRHPEWGGSALSKGIRKLPGRG